MGPIEMNYCEKWHLRGRIRDILWERVYYFWEKKLGFWTMKWCWITRANLLHKMIGELNFISTYVIGLFRINKHFGLIQSTLFNTKVSTNLMCPNFLVLQIFGKEKKSIFEFCCIQFHNSPIGINAC